MNRTCDKTPNIRINNSEFSRIDPEQIEVHVGQHRSRIKVVYDTTKKNKLVYINRYASPLLLLPPNFKIEYKVINHNPVKIKLGPVVGVLTTVKQNESGLPTGKEAHYFAELVSYAQRNGVFVFLFYPEGVNWSNRTIKGYTLDFPKHSSNKWIEGEYPLPDIVYNRLRSRSIENTSAILDLLNKFELNGIYLFNTRFLDKWDVYTILQGNARLVPMLPPTAIFNYDTLVLFLKRYPELFLKPRNSSIGKGIIKVKKVSDCYMFALAQSEKPSWYRYSSSDKLYEAIIAVISDTSRYLVQMGIPLAKIDNKIFDLRVQVQKNGKGIWTLTGIGVRAAAPKHFVTHIPNGGSVRPYKEVIQKNFGHSEDLKKALDKQLHLITTETPVTLEKMSGWLLAILSIDIGIDREGKMWIIEVNSKPSSFDEPEIRRTHLKYFTDYCKYIIDKY